MSDINKTEKLAAAVYLITSFFADQEPLKWKLRSLSSDLVARGLMIKDNFPTDRNKSLLEIRQIAREIGTFFSLARSAGMVSEMNHSLVQQEFDKYLSILELPEGVNKEEMRVEIAI